MAQQDPAGPGQVEDRELAVYKAQRQHELELNRVSAGLELAIVSPTLLNGAAGVAFLTLLGAASGSDSRPQFNLGPARLAIAVSCVGPVVAALAVGAAHQSQRQFTRAVRGGRVQYERKLLDEDPRLKEILPQLKKRRIRIGCEARV
jgi:hypothetical protein